MLLLLGRAVDGWRESSVGRRGRVGESVEGDEGGLRWRRGGEITVSGILSADKGPGHGRAKGAYLALT